jgi:hypothetical protein
VTDTLEAQQPRGEDQKQASRARVIGGIALLVIASATAIWVLLSPPPSRAGVVLLLAIAGFLGGSASVVLAFKGPAVRVVGVAAAIIAVLAAVLAIPFGILPTHQSTKEVLLDDFRHGLDKWTVTTAEGPDPVALGQIHANDGRLHLGVLNNSDAVKATLWPKLPPGKTITKISMKMSLVRQEGNSDGAAYLNVLSAQGRNQRLWMGPDEDGNPALGYYICNVGLCPDRDPQYLSQHSLIKEHEYTVDALLNPEGGLQFNVSEQPSASAERDLAPMTNFAFELAGDPKSNFEVTIDDVRITYIN